MNSSTILRIDGTEPDVDTAFQLLRENNLIEGVDPDSALNMGSHPQGPTALDVVLVQSDATAQVQSLLSDMDVTVTDAPTREEDYAMVTGTVE